MGSNFFDIPFRSRTSGSDFSCNDGELFTVANANLRSDFSGSTGEFSSPSEYNGISSPPVSFSLIRSILPGWHIHPDNFPSKTIAATDPSMEYWTSMGAQLLNLFRSESANCNLFVAPFYVTAVWKTLSGILLSPAPPVLMIPNSNVPLVATDADIDTPELEFKIAGAVCSLSMKLEISEAMRDWAGKIASLEIFVSRPLQSYDSFSSFIPQRRATTDAWCRCRDPGTGIISDHRICTDILPLAWKTSEHGISESLMKNDLSSFPPLSSLDFNHFASIPLSSLDLFDDWKGKESGIGSWGLNSLEKISFKDLSNGESFSTKSFQTIIEGKGEIAEIETRPLKLSGAGELKSLRSIRLRGDYDPSALSISVLASRDMLRWWCVAKKKGGTAVLLTRAPFRFYKVRIQGLLAEGCNLQGLTVCR